jgi:hypothetical protein
MPEILSSVVASTKPVITKIMDAMLWTSLAFSPKNIQAKRIVKTISPLTKIAASVGSVCSNPKNKRRGAIAAPRIAMITIVATCFFP